MKQIASDEFATNTFGDWAYIAIAQHYRKMLSHEAGVLADRDPEELHQMRVGMRRLRTALAGFAPALSLPETAVEKAVGKIARVLGKLRDIDVLGETLKTEYRPQLPKTERKELDRILKALAKERRKVFKTVKKLLQGKTYRKLKKGFESWLANPKYSALACVSIEHILPDLLLPRFGQFFLHPGWTVGGNIGDIPREGLLPADPHTVRQILARQEKKLHDLRKEAKHTRYQMELFVQFYGGEYRDYLKDTKQIQSVLGDIQDSFVLKEFLNRFFGKSFKTRLPALAKHLHKIRWQKWNAWQALHHKFASPKMRQSLRTLAQYPQIPQGDLIAVPSEDIARVQDAPVSTRILP
ncbi:MAG: CHAD domain-containing protein [Cyanobacteria bacterium SBLK]|nr:CHAD domain-containing protein [Cyanobacteria bacterium SBLK]